MPALGGSLFDPDRFPFLEGRAKATTWRDASTVPLPVDNRTVLLLLDALQVLEQRGGAQLLSYRALGVEQIGQVYEGLLEYTVSKLDKVTVGLIGSQKVPRPSITLVQLETLKSQGQEKAVEHLAELTGRSAAAIGNALTYGGDEQALLQLIHTCDGNETLARQLLPYADLIRADSWGTKLVYRPGFFAIVHGSDRRETGTHYTPKSLTESIVEKTLETIVYAGPAEGEPPERWKLKTPSELMDVKVCDPAMGSGAFLVQVCRYLAERLVQAWAREEATGKVITVDGVILNAIGRSDPMPQSLDERLIIAKRLIAERCLYGVDINSLAVELAKLSIWLVTMAKGRPFGFLDHNLRSGDSLLGIDRLEQLTTLDLSPVAEQQQRLFGRTIKASVDEALVLRGRLRETRIRDIKDVEVMSGFDAESRRKLEWPLRLSDAFIGLGLTCGDNVGDFDASLNRLAIDADKGFKGDNDGWASASRTAIDTLSANLPPGRSRRRPFHWPLEFPEVFVRKHGGFDAVVGNPPFLGNRLWKSMLHERMQWQAQMILGISPGKIDLSVIFHRRAVVLLRDNGAYGLLATTNISEGTAIPIGLGEIVSQGSIIFSHKCFRWPGKASVTTAIVCFYKGNHLGLKSADGHTCKRIGPKLEPEAVGGWEPVSVPEPLFSFAGVDNSKGLAFVIQDNDPWFSQLSSGKSSLLRPYVSGEDITDHCLRRVDRWALDLADMDLAEIERRFPQAYRFLLEVVRPTRTVHALKSYKGLHDRWWQFWNHRADMFRRLRRHEQCVVFSKVTKHPLCVLANTTWIYTNKVVLVGTDSRDTHAICVSSFFTEWMVARQGAKLGVGASLCLSIRDAIDTFPRPATEVSDRGVKAALLLDQEIKEWCIANSCGITAFADALGDDARSDTTLRHARRLLNEIDSEVAAAYGWKGFSYERGFHPAHYIAGGKRVAFVLSPTARAAVVDYLVERNRDQCQRSRLA